MNSHDRIKQIQEAHVTKYTFKSHDDVKCFHCQKKLKTISGLTNRDPGKYMKGCLDCGLLTYYDLEGENGTTSEARE